ncbi:Tau-tubulin kinase [Dirofilaria immitis]
MGKEDLRKIKLKIGSIVKNQWQIIRRIGEGGCGLVFQVVNMQNPIQMAAMKTEPIGMFSDDQILKMEVHVLKKLNKSQHACRIYASGKGQDYYFLIMTLLSKSLCELRKQCPNQRFTLPTSVKLCIQCLEGIEDLHNIGFIHRDVKPSNFAMGRKPSVMRTVFMLDFGLARQYCTFDEKGNSKLREPRKTAPFRGTIRYCSINVHCGDEQGRHDDLWSLLYMTAEMILGTLPWHRMDRAHAEICKIKSEEKLISSLPMEFHVFIRHLKKLNYNHKPDYNLLQSLLKQILKRKNHNLTDPYDWEPDGEYASKFNRHVMRSKKLKASDEKFEIDKGDKSDMNTRMGIKTIEEEINITSLLKEEDEEGASRVSGVSRTDDTLQKLDELK